MKKLLLSASLIIVFIFACNDPASIEPNILKYSDYKVLENQSESVIMPLAVGNKWVFEGNKYNKDGSEGVSIYDSIIVQMDEIFDGERYFDTYTSFDFQCRDFFINKSNGLWSKCEPPQMEAKYPANPGNEFKYEKKEKYPVLINGQAQIIETTMISTNKVISTNEEVNTTAGKFYAYVYEETYDIQSDDLPDIELQYYPKIIKYYVPDIGPVKFEYYQKDDQNSDYYLVSKTELVYYELY